MKEKRKKSWETARQKGRSYFVVTYGFYGILLLGILGSIFEFIYHYFISGYNFSFVDKSFVIGIFINLFIAFPLGCLIGLVVWHLNENKFVKEKKQ